MTQLPSRRQVALGLAAAPFIAPGFALAADDKVAAATTKSIANLEKSVGGRLGVTLIDAAGKVLVAHRADERFPMCSTFKLIASAAVLAKVDKGTEKLDRVIHYKESDLLSYAPVSKAHVGEGGLKLGDLCAAAVQWSDNTAANLILNVIGGPKGFTDFCRTLGDKITRLDRTEPTLNTAIAGDPRDTTSPKAMAETLRAALIGETLTVQSRQQLADWAIGDKVGGKRVRAGLPKDWTIGDKTGAGAFGSTNTIGFIKPAGSDRDYFFTVYLTQSKAPIEALEAVHKAVGEIFAKFV